MNVQDNGNNQTLPDLRQVNRQAARPIVKLRFKETLPAKPVAKKSDRFASNSIYLCYVIIIALAASIGFALYLLWEKISF